MTLRQFLGALDDQLFWSLGNWKLDLKVIWSHLYMSSEVCASTSPYIFGPRPSLRFSDPSLLSTAIPLNNVSIYWESWKETFRTAPREICTWRPALRVLHKWSREAEATKGKSSLLCCIKPRVLTGLQRQLPPGLSARDAAILNSVRKRAHHLDKGFSLCGMRFGWTFLIGLIPIAGDAANAYLNYTLVVRKAQKADLPDWLIGRMLLNNAISAGVGFIPIVGDLILAMYKANSRNAALLDEFLRIRSEAFLKMHEAEENKENSGKVAKGDLSAADIEQVKPGSGMTPSEKGKVANHCSKDTGVPLASSSTGVPPTHAKSRLFGMLTKKEQPAMASTSGPKGRFVENIEL